MAFVNLSLLLGGLFTAIPVVLHLVMRRQPKRLAFPAMQFLRQRRESNRRKLQLKHWLLLALRCAAIMLLAVAFARPSVLSAVAGRSILVALAAAAAALCGGLCVVSIVQHKGRLLTAALAAMTLAAVIALASMILGMAQQGRNVLLGDEQAPVAAALVFDTAPHMEYRYQNRTRREIAQEMGLWLVGQLPPDSRVAVLDSRPAPAVFAVDQAAARKAIQRLQSTALSQPLPRVLQRALKLIVASDKARQEIYLFTDLSRSSWENEVDDLSRALDAHPHVSLYVIDVGVAQPRNVSLGPLELSAETLAKSNELRIAAAVHSRGIDGPQIVELLLESPDSTLPIVIDGHPKLPELRPRGRREIMLESGQSQRVEFRLRGLEPGVHHGIVTLVGDDGLEADNVRHFTIEVKPAWPVLVVAPENVASSLFTEAIAPREFAQAGQARFECTVVAPSALANRDLNQFAVVCLLDPEPIPSVTWEQMGKYVRAGGGLAVFLGHNARAATSFNEPAAQQLLGGRLARVWRSPDRSLWLAPDRYDHPVMAPLGGRTTSVPWNAAPVFKHWVLEPLSDDASIVVRYSSGKAAVVERSVGLGRAITMTTPVSDPLRGADHSAWNELPTSDQAWPYVVLVNELMLYLTDSSATRLNYVAGETAALPNDARIHPLRYQLFTPDELPQEARAANGEITVRYTEVPGAYRLKGAKDGPLVRGFAVNLAPRATELARLTPGELDELLGDKRYQLARNRDEIELEVGEARVGREFYGHLLALLAVVLSVEHLMANRFYRNSE